MALVSLFLFRQQPGDAPLPIYGNVPAFELTESAGIPFHSTQISNKVWLASFIFTRCEGICPLVSAKLARIQDAFAKESDFHLVSISVDPEYDTPERLVDYAQKFRASPAQWHFLTGDMERLKTLLTDGILVGFGDEPVFHSDRSVLIDQQAQIRC